MKIYYLIAVGLLAAGVGVAAATRPSVEWTGGKVSAEKISYQSRAKVLFTFTNNVQATAPDIELLHADKATAEADPRMHISTIKANGNVRFTARRATKEQVTKVAGTCNEGVVYNPGGKKPKGDERILVADLNGDVTVTMTRADAPGAKPAGEGAKPAAGSAGPGNMTVRGDHARLWVTEEGIDVEVE